MIRRLRRGLHQPIPVGTLSEQEEFYAGVAKRTRELEKRMTIQRLRDEALAARTHDEKAAIQQTIGMIERGTGA